MTRTPGEREIETLALDPQGAQDGKESRGLHQAAGRGWSSEPQPASWAALGQHGVNIMDWWKHLMLRHNLWSKACQSPL